jgi:hypothetical protein
MKQISASDRHGPCNSLESKGNVMAPTHDPRNPLNDAAHRLAAEIETTGTERNGRAVLERAGILSAGRRRPPGRDMRTR